MDAFELSAIVAQQAEGDSPYLEFLRVPSMSMGLYVLPAGGEDKQQPHTEDEVYYIVKGKATIRVADEDRSVQAGSIVYVAAHVEHRFHTIMEDLQILVFFAPHEYANVERQ
ncbi:MAG: cupin domain-containing protein [Chloroflexi bacterium]|nr:MAG: cupin domain-containing protein [Phototrophicales bacterium]RMF77761.1 MAG: cupin domain-containing protein [Chloroflexota bacterium]